jgi:hypothetical protein
MPLRNGKNIAPDSPGRTQRHTKPPTTQTGSKYDPIPSTTSSAKAVDSDDEMDTTVAMDHHKGSEPSLTPSQVSRQQRLLMYLANKKNAAISDVCRLIIIAGIVLSCIVCIALDRDRQYFTNVLTLIIGIIIDSPLARRNFTQQSSSAPPATAAATATATSTATITSAQV